LELIVFGVPPQYNFSFSFPIFPNISFPKMSAESAESAEFVVFYEKNHKENELFIFYLQWTGNEEELTKLHKFVSKARYDDMDGDYSQVKLDLSVKLPQSAVDLHCRLHDMNNYFNLFTKVTGMFKCPFGEKDEDMDEYETAKRIDEIFYSCNIRDMFI
jgi:hypothetical protein